MSNELQDYLSYLQMCYQNPMPNASEFRKLKKKYENLSLESKVVVDEANWK